MVGFFNPGLAVKIVGQAHLDAPPGDRLRVVENLDAARGGTPPLASSPSNPSLGSFTLASRVGSADILSPLKLRRTEF